MARRLVLLALALGSTTAACAEPAGAPAEEEHHDMPEAAAPLAQRVETAPVAEVFLDRVGLEAAFTLDGAARTSAELVLPAEASRASVWLSLASGPAPKIEVQAGWSSGQTGPWVALSTVWE